MKRLSVILVALLLVFSMAVSVGAKENPSPETPAYLSINVHANGSGVASASPIKVDPNNPKPVELDATEKGADFIRWEITGSYTIVSGSLTSPKLVILPTSNIDATAIFKDASNAGNQNDSETSPHTGDMSVYVLGALLSSLLVFMIAAKKVKA